MALHPLFSPYILQRLGHTSLIKGLSIDNSKTEPLSGKQSQIRAIKFFGQNEVDICHKRDSLDNLLVNR